MLRILLVITSTLAICGGAIAETYTIRSWPDDLDQVPCEAWKKNPDGSWTQTGTILIESISGARTGNTFNNTPEALIVEKKCGTGKGDKGGN
jgi:hypothetical protein